MLIIQPDLQRLLAIRIQRQQIVYLLVRRCSTRPRQCTVVSITRSGNPAIFGLHVEYGSVDGDICVVTEQHAFAHLRPDRETIARRLFFARRI